MRRTDRENSTEEFYDLVFAHAEEIFLAMNDGVYPYGVILNFVRKDKIIYLHSAKMAKNWIACAKTAMSLFAWLAISG